MRMTLFALALLVSTPVFADQARELAEFLEEYKSFLEDRRIQNNSQHNASFHGEFVFRKGCIGHGFYDQSCVCPPGNHHIQCLTKANAIIDVDPKDVGGRGYVRITAGQYALNQDGQWVPFDPSSQRDLYSFIIERLSNRHVINIPLPPRSLIASACSTGVVQVSVGYGAVMPMDIEFARRMKASLKEVNRKYDEQEYIMSVARTNGMHQKKGAVIGTMSCKRPKYNSD